jgi:peptidoglycan hydrolase-like protein with peptidoglycan-binding domain
LDLHFYGFRFSLSLSRLNPPVPLSLNLSYGSRGADVVQLQNFLIAQSLLPQGDNTGYFGGLTKAAVIAFQTQQSVPSTGLVGPRTRAAIARVCGSNRTVDQTMNQKQTTNTATTTNIATAAPAITLDPESGQAGLPVYLYFSGHVSDPMTARFGSVSAPVHVLSQGCTSANTAHCGHYVIVPQLGPGDYVLTVTSADGTSNKAQFTYNAPPADWRRDGAVPRLSSLDPSQGSIGTGFKINATGFTKSPFQHFIKGYKAFVA